MQPDGVFVENFAIRRRSPEELALVRKVPNACSRFNPIVIVVFSLRLCFYFVEWQDDLQR